MHELLFVLRQIGRANLSVGRVYEGHVNALQPLQTFGTADQMAAGFIKAARKKYNYNYTESAITLSQQFL